MELAKSADWIVDLGPEAGDEGGRLVGEGTPETVAALDTPTGRALAEALGRPPERACARAARGRGRSRRAAGPSAHPHQGRARAQPAARGRRHPARQARRDHRRLGLGQVDARVRRAVRRGPAALPRLPVDLRAPVHPAAGAARGGPPRRRAAHRRARAEALARHAALDGRHRERGLPPPAPALVAARRGALPEVRPARAGGGHGGARRARGLGLPEAASSRSSRRSCGGARASTRTPSSRSRSRASPRCASTARSTRPRRRRASTASRSTTSRRWSARVGERTRPAGLEQAIARALELGAGTLLALGKGGERFYSTRRACPSCGTGLPAPDPRLFSWSQKYGACPECDGFGAPRVEEDGELRRAEGVACPACAGTRLRPEARAVRIAGRHIGEVAALTLREVRAWLGTLEGQLPDEVRERVWPELVLRLDLLDRLGLSYLTLERGADTLSTGEAQRIRIVAALASNLRGVCYVLDEPTVGLHPRDDEALTQALLGLRDRGNTVVVVEHEESVIRAADHLIDLGPGAGPHGGRLVAQGSPRQVARVKESVTGRWLRGDGRAAALAAAQPEGRRPARGDGRAAPQPARPDGRVPARALHGRDRRLGLGQVDAGARRALPRGEGAPRRPAAAAGRCGSSRACAASRARSRSTSRRSAARRAPCPRPTSGSWTRSARCSPRCPTRARSATARAASRST